MNELFARLMSDGGLSTALLAGAVVYLWRELRTCKENHLDCERKNVLLAQSIIAIADGKGHEGKATAETIIKQARSELGGK